MSIAIPRPGSLRSPSLAALLSGAALALIAALAPASASAAPTVTDVSFDTPVFVAGTVVDEHFRDINGDGTRTDFGVRFVPTGDLGERPLPVLRQDSTIARSGARMLDITTAKPAEEFPNPGLEGRLDITREDLSLYVRNLGPGTPTLRLQARTQTGVLIDETAPVELAEADNWVELAVSSTVPNIQSFRIVSVGAGGAAAEVRVDDLSYQYETPPQPDYSVFSEVRRVTMLPGESREFEIDVDRLNSSNGTIALEAQEFLDGAEASITPSTLPGTGSSATATLTLDPSVSPSSGAHTLRIRGTTSDPGAGPVSFARTFDIEYRIETPYNVGPEDGTELEVYSCSSGALEVRAVRNAAFSDPIDLDLTRGDGSPLPDSIQYSFDPPTLTGGGGTSQTSTLTVSRGDDLVGGRTSARVVADSGGITRSFEVGIERPIPEVTGWLLADRPLIAPQGLEPGSRVDLFGRGICDDAVHMSFGGTATAPVTVSPAPTAAEPDRVRVTARTPRLATDGPLTVRNPSGARAGTLGVFPDAEVHSYRNRFGFNFPNERHSTDPSVGAGGIRDWQELLGPRQTQLNACEIGLLFPGCHEVLTPVPRPEFLIMQTIFGDAALWERNGTCNGFAVGSRRIAAGQVAVHGRPGTAGVLGVAPVWSIQRSGREWIPGRTDIPFQAQQQMSPIKYLAIEHASQFTAEYISAWVQRRTLNAGDGPRSGLSVMRARLQDHLRAGRAPLLGINWEGNGHIVNVYDIEDRPGGGYHIRIYNNNQPFLGSENSNATQHEDREQNLGRITVLPNGDWRASNLSGSAPDAGPPGDLFWIDPETEIPVNPTSLASLEGLRVLATPNFAAVAGRGNAARAAGFEEDGLLELGVLDGSSEGMVAAASDRSHQIPLSSPGGRFRAGAFGEGTTSEIDARGASGGDDVILPKGTGVGFDAGSKQAKVGLTLATEKTGRLVTVRGASRGATQLRFAGRQDKVKLTHKGDGGAVKLELASYGRGAVPTRLLAKLRLGKGARVTLKPKWKRLGRKVVARVNGKRRVLRNRAKPPVRVKKMRVKGAQKKGQAITKVRAKLRGKVKKLSALVVGVEVRRGKKVVGRAEQQLKPNAKSVRRLARGIKVPAKLKSSKGKLRVRATVSAVVAKPLPSASTVSKSTRLR